ncbi:3-hydroxyacyl-CoA dehydrogenase family protein [Mobilicoccus massiliensis]|uniref:3-hydroxyacyl-CoA dehydrogenase family protein n=1 Tax=Mobilicoccus massiliensis TaxID=1522310 RepID=UPI00058C5E3A|nr:3-hydroxybutyryl-CoA dehydrogenase [Mobilicoccus massiliensis]
MAREITKIGVIGLGTMGAGIVEVCARSGFEVVGVEMNAAAVERGRGHLENSTGRAVQRGKMSEEDQAALLGRVTTTDDMSALADCGLVIEAVPESLDIKRSVFTTLDGIVGDDAILATNTSSLSVTDIATATKDPSRVIGLHFFNPAPVQKLVEIIATVITSPDVLEDVRALAEKLGKEPVVVGDQAGFIANRLLLAYLNRAVMMYENKYASREDIDAAMTLGCGLPMGPLALLDLIGLDVAYAVLDTIYKEGRDKLHAPAPMLKQMITAGLLGRKTGRGFYTYEKPGSGKVVDDPQTPRPAADGKGIRPIHKVGVVGSGTMATGIAEVFAKAGYPVQMVSRHKGRVEEAYGAIQKSLAKAVQRGKLTDEVREKAIASITTSDSLETLADVDIVDEAISEELSTKQAMFENLDEICKPGAILATTTSSLPVIEVAVATSRPADVIGMHFFNPAQVMKLVEIVSTVATAADVEATIVDLCDKIGKRGVECADRSGFIVNSLLFPYLNDAIKMLEAHYATTDDIDLAMKAGCGYPMGPFELLDIVGLDVSLAIQRELYLEFRERGFAPAPLLEHLVKAGYLGRKSKRGFRTYA